MTGHSISELCRAAEGQGHFDRAVAEYQKLAAAYPAERQALLALMAAGRLSLKQLKNPTDALRFYEETSRSSVPHLDWDTNIQAGIENSTKALTSVPV